MEEIPFIDNPEQFRKELKKIHNLRKSGKSKVKRKYRLTKQDRVAIHAKTSGKCHVCGRDVSVEGFEADHVHSHSSGGSNKVDNFLPSCKTCNNYRWHYLPDEFQWILKLGVWAKTEVINDTTIGKLLAEKFIKHEVVREGRRRKPRLT